MKDSVTSANGHPRRIPQQERSRLMRERILDSGQRVLVSAGYEATTTAAIAVHANISPGSLYQYFPNKDAIVTAVIRRHLDHVFRTVTTEVIEHVGRTPDVESARRVLGVLLDSMSEHPEIVRTIAHASQLGLDDVIRDFEVRIGDLARAQIRLSSTVPKNAEAIVWIAVRVVEHVCIRYILDAPPIDRDDFLDEMATLIYDYSVKADRPQA